ncbi:SDR family oxidoreductase [Serratia marcescens]|jgi:NAD(P)-dependent dehydrogenase (short-subunit alcohol dehydrogenase family)|uniref:Short chain dehydrogenase n=1 Tax=Serratia marcescens subsp. marcescens Db11 TaxID=273526 RepID=A0ABC9IGJ8_SERMA|nr:MULTISPECIES: SDR family oxidoreductase [Serratia]MBK5571948.1 SDR family oxidoreductase [Serratia marcescens]MBN5179129.1 SDR family oxidoreductase [Serratia marcescens]NMT24780.1 SDR family oxidoreductase [Serratia marcescens]QIR63907.1 SDR family oxidoreductase [Serratia marcescens]UMK59221.1 SDR family oxidoreductase [Serratia marcescens]
MNALNGKVAVIGGASSGIGKAAALLFARQGAALVLGARREPLLAELVEDIRREGGRALAVAGDVRDEAFAERLTATAVDEFGGLDIAFNNAGTLGPLGPSLAHSASEWRDVLETNLSSAYYSAKYQIPAMLARGAGSVIFTSTFVGHTAAFPGTAAYAASKSGLIGLTQALAVEFGGRGIRVNALLPGGTDTAMGRQMSNTPEALAQVAELHALKRLAMPEEIAQAALYLASDASSFVTGTAMLVDGGVSIQRG